MSDIEIKKANEKFKRGDQITDEELKTLLNVHTVIADKLFLLGEIHRLSFIEINSQKKRLEDMKKARKE